MSIEKNMNARIQHKHDIEANWNKALNFIPKIGEIIVYDIDDNYNYSRFKIGDGIRTINNLEFLLDTRYILHNSNTLSQALEQHISDIDTHNKSEAAHSDIRQSVSDLGKRVGPDLVSKQISNAINELNKVYVQPEDPIDAKEGSVWVDTDEDFDNNIIVDYETFKTEIIAEVIVALPKYNGEVIINGI